MLPGFTGAEGPELQTQLDLFTLGGMKCGVRPGDTAVTPSS